MFGPQSQGLFGTTAQPSTGGGLFGAQTGSFNPPAQGNIFQGSQPTGLFGQTQPGFGQQTQTQAPHQSQPLFGTNFSNPPMAQTGFLGNTNLGTGNTTSGSLFGAPANTQQPMGGTTSFLGNSFGQPSNTGFGFQPQTTAALFGATQQNQPAAGLFGQPAQPNQPFSLMGNQPQPTHGFMQPMGQGQQPQQPGLGMGGNNTFSTFGAQNPNNTMGGLGFMGQNQSEIGNRVPFVPQPSRLPALSSEQGLQIMCINYMEQYKQFAKDELRLIDYRDIKAGKIQKGGQPSGMQCFNGQPQTGGSLWDQKPPSGQPTGTLFGQITNNQPAQPSSFQTNNASNTFGFGLMNQKPQQPPTSGFLSTPAASGSLFGNATSTPQLTTGSLFQTSNNQPNSNPSQNQQPLASGSLFATNQTQPSNMSGCVFQGQQNQPYGGNTFNTQPNQNQGLLSQPQNQSVPQQSLFTPSATNFNHSSFSNPAGGSLFNTPLFSNQNPQPAQQNQPTQTNSLFTENKTNFFADAQNLVQNTANNNVNHLSSRNLNWDEYKQKYANDTPYQQISQGQPNQNPYKTVFYQTWNDKNNKYSNEFKIENLSKSKTSLNQSNRLFNIPNASLKKDSELDPKLSKGFTIFPHITPDLKATIKIEYPFEKLVDIPIKLRWTLNDLKNRIMDCLEDDESKIFESNLKNYSLIMASPNPPSILENTITLKKIQELPGFKEFSFQLVCDITEEGEENDFSQDSQGSANNEEEFSYKINQKVRQEDLPIIPDEYKTVPNRAKISKMTYEELNNVSDFIISNEYGAVRFLEKLSLFRQNLARIVQIQQNFIELYPQKYYSKEDTPSPGEGFNLKAEIIFKSFGWDQLGEEATEEKKQKLKKKVEKWAVSNKMQIIAPYDPEQGILRVQVEHF